MFTCSACLYLLASAHSGRTTFCPGRASGLGSLGDTTLLALANMVCGGGPGCSFFRFGCLPQHCVALQSSGFRVTLRPCMGSMVKAFGSRCHRVEEFPETPISRHKGIDIIDLKSY